MKRILSSTAQTVLYACRHKNKVLNEHHIVHNDVPQKN